MLPNDEYSAGQQRRSKTQQNKTGYAVDHSNVMYGKLGPELAGKNHLANIGAHVNEKACTENYYPFFYRVRKCDGSNGREPKRNYAGV